MQTRPNPHLDPEGCFLPAPISATAQRLCGNLIDGDLTSSVLEIQAYEVQVPEAVSGATLAAGVVVLRRRRRA